MIFSPLHRPLPMTAPYRSPNRRPPTIPMQHGGGALFSESVTCDHRLGYILGWRRTHYSRTHYHHQPSLLPTFCGTHNTNCTVYTGREWISKISILYKFDILRDARLTTQTRSKIKSTDSRDRVVTSAKNRKPSPYTMQAQTHHQMPGATVILKLEDNAAVASAGK